MIALLGDIHAVPDALERAVAAATAADARALVQLGDFGVYHEVMDRFAAIAASSPIPIYFIDGNHEDFRLVTPWWRSLEASDALLHHVVSEKLMYVRRGAVIEIDGRRIAFLGGAGSIDYAFRVRGQSWFDEEQIRDSDVDFALSQARGHRVDMLLVHTPPQRVITKHFDTPPSRALQVRLMFGASPDWFDPSAHQVDAVWEQLGFPPLYAGHMHVSLDDMGCRLLNINEMMMV